jgi:hypothetical protein
MKNIKSKKNIFKKINNVLVNYSESSNGKSPCLNLFYEPTNPKIKRVDKNVPFID